MSQKLIHSGVAKKTVNISSIVSAAASALPLTFNFSNEPSHVDQ